MNDTQSPLSQLLSDPFPLEEPHVVALQRYAYSGAMLPVTHDEYLQSVTIHEVVARQCRQNIDWIVNVYSNIREHSREFKDNLFPNIISLASSLYHYSKDAFALYDEIEALEQLNESASFNSSETERNIKRQAKVIGALVDKQVDAMKEMIWQSDKIVDDLRHFGHDTGEDEMKAKDEANGLAQQWNDNDAYVTTLRQKIDNIRNFLETQQDAYDEALDGMCEGVGQWCRIPLIGWITKAGVLSKSGRRAVKAAMNIAHGDNNLTEYEQIMMSFTVMSTEVEIIMADLARIVQLIDPAVQTIQLMQGCFSAICDDLMYLKQKVNNNLGSYSIVSGAETRRAKADWEELGRRADHYRLVAFVRPVDVNSLNLSEAPEVW